VKLQNHGISQEEVILKVNSPCLLPLAISPVFGLFLCFRRLYFPLLPLVFYWSCASLKHARMTFSIKEVKFKENNYLAFRLTASTAAKQLKPLKISHRQSITKKLIRQRANFCSEN
jgi:hypothetical protein